MSAAIPRMRPELYLDFDRAAEYKSEFLDGIMYAMAGGSRPHSLLSLGIGAELRRALSGKKCEAYNGDIRTLVGPRTAYFYPDCSVYCSEAITADERKDIFTNPTLVVEILSSSTEAYDRGEKFSRYRQIESLQQYVLVSQSERRIEVFTRQADETWTAAVYTAVCSLESIGCEINVADVYEGVTLPEPLNAE